MRLSPQAVRDRKMKLLFLLFFVCLYFVSILRYNTIFPTHRHDEVRLEPTIMEVSNVNVRTVVKKTAAKKCTSGINQGMEAMIKQHSRSQSGEDKFLLAKYFHGLCGGTYLEMGGYDGVKYSNSHLFNKAFGWKGVLVELGPLNFQKLQKNRPNEIATVNAAICGKRQTIHYVEKDAVGGIWEFSSKSFRNRWWQNITLEKTTEIECSPLKDVLSAHAPNTTHYDFFSLDIEGGELDALLSLDYSRVSFGIIFAEADHHNTRKNLALRMFLQSKGYTYLETNERSDWFVNNNFHSIYEDVI